MGIFYKDKEKAFEDFWRLIKLYYYHFGILPRYKDFPDLIDELITSYWNYLELRGLLKILSKESWDTEKYIMNIKKYVEDREKGRRVSDILFGDEL